MSRLNVFGSPVEATGQSLPRARTINTPHVGPAAPPASAAHDADRGPGSTAFPDDQLVSFTKPDSFEAEQYRTLCQILEIRRNSSALQVVAVSSAGIGDGKTTTTLNLAATLARSPDSRVLIIDADLRCSAVAAQLRLGDPGRPGLAGALCDQTVSLASASPWLPEWNLSVLAAGRVEKSPYELLKSGAFARIVEEARGRFEFVLIDCPPLPALPDCRLIERVVDGFQMVVSADRTPRRLLEEALNVLPAERVIGIIFNRDAHPLSGYYRYYGRYYGGRPGSRKA